MMKNWLMGCGLGLTLLLSTSILAAEVAKENQAAITVNGESEIKIAPNEVVTIFGVETWHATIDMAKKGNDERVRRILDLMEGLGVDSKNYQTDFFSVTPTYVDQEGVQQLKGYWVRKHIVVTLRDIGRLEELLSKALNAGANQILDVRFRTTELKQYRDQARLAALRNAQEKARLMAQTMDMHIGKPITIQEEPTGWWSWYDTWWGDRRITAENQNMIQQMSAMQDIPLGEGVLAVGRLGITARVTVTFALE